MERAEAGIGKELTKKFISIGHNVYVVSRDRENLTSLKTEIDSDRLFVYSGDISEKESVERIYDEVINQAKYIDVLINNAGLDPVNRFTSLDWDSVEETINVNLKGHIYMTMLVVKDMIDNGRSGHIVNMSSLMGLIPIQYEVLYCATKFGLQSKSEVARWKKHTANYNETTKRYPIACSSFDKGTAS